MSNSNLEHIDPWRLCSHKLHSILLQTNGILDISYWLLLVLITKVYDHSVWWACVWCHFLSLCICQQDLLPPSQTLVPIYHSSRTFNNCCLKASRVTQIDLFLKGDLLFPTCSSTSVCSQFILLIRSLCGFRFRKKECEVCSDIMVMYSLQSDAVSSLLSSSNPSVSSS
jgi:hypothetical protein